MNDVKNIIENSNNSIRIKTCDANSVVSITVPSKELPSKGKENTCAFKVHEGGKIIFDCKNDENNSKEGIDSIKQGISKEGIDSIKHEISKEKLSTNVDRKPNNENQFDMFEKIPKDLSQEEINKIKEFIKEKAIIEAACSRILPYSVALTEGGDIKITLVAYDADTLQLNLPKIALKLIDANKSIIIADLVDINIIVNPKKIGIFETIVNKEKLKEETINLDEWEISFSI